MSQPAPLRAHIRRNPTPPTPCASRRPGNPVVCRSRFGKTRAAPAAPLLHGGAKPYTHRRKSRVSSSCRAAPPPCPARPGAARARPPLPAPAAPHRKEPAPPPRRTARSPVARVAPGKAPIAPQSSATARFARPGEKPAVAPVPRQRAAPPSPRRTPPRAGRTPRPHTAARTRPAPRPGERCAAARSVAPAAHRFRALLWRSLCLGRGASIPAGLRLETAAPSRVNFREIADRGYQPQNAKKRPLAQSDAVIAQTGRAAAL